MNESHELLFEFSKPITSDGTGESVECQRMTITAPSMNQADSCAALEALPQRSMMKAMKDMPKFEDTRTADEKKKDKDKKDDPIANLTQFGGLGEALTLLTLILVKTTVLDNGVKLNAETMKRIGYADSKRLLKEYFEHFLGSDSTG